MFLSFEDFYLPICGPHLNVDHRRLKLAFSIHFGVIWRFQRGNSSYCLCWHFLQVYREVRWMCSILCPGRELRQPREFVRK